MNFIGDYFAIGLVIILCMFYFDRNHMWTTSSKYFFASLIFTALTAAVDILTGALLVQAYVPLWLNITANSLYFIVNIITTSFIALFLFTKILEHVYDDHCMQMAKRGLFVIFGFFLIMVFANIWTGWMFSFDADNLYQRGPLNALGYIMVLAQMVLVLICYTRNRRNASSIMRRVLLRTFPVILVCIIIQRVFPDIMLNGLLISFMDTVLFLTFQGHHQGVHNLTKLNDRHRFFKEMEAHIAANAKDQIFLISIKDFGIVNEKFGHLFGDEALYQFAFSLERLIKAGTAFHMNGTVFALTIPYTTQAAAEEHCSRLLGFLDDGISCKHEHLQFDYVIVEYFVDEKEKDAAELYEKLEYASATAYAHKQKFITYTSDIGDKMHRTHYLIERLKHIDAEHGYEVWYQPVKNLQNDAFSSMEALIRLREKDGSLISPCEFIPLAEQTGLIHSLTWFVLESICKFLSKQAALNKVTVSFNLPMIQLLEGGFTTKLNSIVDRYGIDHERICLEFTERELLDNFKKTKEVMQTLVADGYIFYLDDFGTGYSNFHRMLQLPFQFIKLDRSLTQSKDLVRTLTKLFHDMHLKVVAEGVETLDDVKEMTACSVDRIQGYYFTKPMDEEKVIAFYQKHPIE